MRLNQHFGLKIVIAGAALLAMLAIWVAKPGIAVSMRQCDVGQILTANKNGNFVCTYPEKVTK